MGCGVYWQQIGELDRAMRSLRRFGITEFDPAYQTLASIRSGLLKHVGFKYPRTITQLARLAALSPGEVKLWHDVESGWMAEIRDRAGDPPRYRYVDDETAVKVLQGTLTHDEFTELAVPDDYLGE